MKECELNIKSKTTECSLLLLKVRTLKKELKNVHNVNITMEKKERKIRCTILEKTSYVKKLTSNNKNLRDLNSSLKRCNRETNILAEKNRQQELALEQDQAKFKIADLYLQKELSESSRRSRYIFCCFSFFCYSLMF